MSIWFWRKNEMDTNPYCPINYRWWNAIDDPQRSQCKITNRFVVSNDGVISERNSVLNLKGKIDWLKKKAYSVKIPWSSRQWLLRAATDDMIFYHKNQDQYLIDIIPYNMGVDFEIKIENLNKLTIRRINVGINVGTLPVSEIDRIMTEYHLSLYDLNWNPLSMEDELINLPKNIQEFFLYHLK